MLSWGSAENRVLLQQTKRNLFLELRKQVLITQECLVVLR